MVAYASVIDGPWANQPTWGGVGPPGDGDTVTINNTVYIDSDVTIGVGVGTAITITTGGRLRWPVAPAGNWTLNIKGNVDVLNGGIFEVGNETERIPAANTATVIFNMSNAMLDIAATGGTFKAYGAQNYHCASEALQRTALSGGVIAGLRTITMSDPADYQTGDTVWVGGYAGKTTSVYGVVIEKVAITRVSATQFTATFVHNHDDGDFLVNQARNVIIQGKSATEGYSINGTFGATFNVFMKADWAFLDRIGYGAGSYQEYGFSIKHTNSAETNVIPAGTIGCTNCCLNSLSWAAGSSAFYLEMFTTLADADVAFKNINFYNNAQNAWVNCFIFNGGALAWPGTVGQWRFDNLTGLCYGAMTYILYANVTQFSVGASFDGLWWSCYTGFTGLSFAESRPIATLTNAKLYGFDRLFSGSSPAIPGSQLHQDFLMSNVLWYHSGGTTVVVCGQPGNDETRRYILKNCTFHDHTYYPIHINSPYEDVIVDTCSFDRCNTSNTVLNCGAVYIGYAGAYQGRGSCLFYNCTFGTISPNYFANVYIGRSLGADVYYTGTLGHRILFDKCTFKKPTNFAWAGAASGSWTDTMAWALVDGNAVLNDWRVRSRWGSNLTVEFCNCVVQDAGGVDQWPITYPNVTRLGVVSGGSEIRKEVITVLDSSYALKIFPYNATARCHVTRTVPVKIPSNAGQTVTVKLSLQKNQLQAAGRRPRIHLYGLGIDTYAEMPDTIGAWEELTVTGITTVEGVVQFWVSVINEPDNTIAYKPDPYNSPKVLGWLTIYADKIVVTVT